MSANQNKYFKNARERAAKILKDKDLLKNLMNNSGQKLKGFDFSKLGGIQFVDRLKVIIRMVRAYKAGDYRDIQTQNILLMVAALLYFVTPVDLIPDFIPITGFVDDFGVVVWVYTKLQEEIDKFLLWEEETTVEG